MQQQKHFSKLKDFQENLVTKKVGTFAFFLLY